MEKRLLGKTGLSLSILGFGGFHLLECSLAETGYLLNRYLDAGGNYIETAAGYGDGLSEKKIGKTITGRRQEYILATKGHDRTGNGILASLHNSLQNLKTDYVDLFFIHAVQDRETVEQVCGEEGALAGALQAKEEGKIRYLAVSGHGRQEALHYALQKYPFDVLMTGFNYYDYCNFPYNEQTLLPLCQQTNTGVLAMKALADGYLYRSVAAAFRYALSLPVTAVVAGINSRDQLETDLKLCREFTPLEDEEKANLLKTAPELGTYVCRQCGQCRSSRFDPAEIFLLEGLYDRQMDDKLSCPPDQYALRERLRFWFDQREKARTAYRFLQQTVDVNKDYSSFNAHCPYHIDINRKLKLCHEKLGNDGYIF